MYTDERDRLWKQLSEASSFFIYGAQVVAYGVYTAILEVLYKKPDAFLVSSMDKNPLQIDGVPVMKVDSSISRDSLIIVAVPEIYHNDIRGNLEYFKLTNFLCVDTHIEYLIMSRYFQKNNNFMLLEDIPLRRKMESNLTNITMYMAKFHKDSLLSKSYDIPEWIMPIQVGAALTESSVADLKDNTGDNISVKNSNYSELTAMYWVWKNRDDEYMGICHYRRILCLDRENIGKIRENGINVVLPLPFICYPNAMDQYGRYISAKDQEKMLEALKKVSQKYFIEAEILLKDKYLYNYNMFLADRKTFQDYCAWLFPILEYVEKLCEPDGRVRKDRYIGYVGEVLTSLYFRYNNKKLKIAHAEKKWMV